MRPGFQPRELAPRYDVERFSEDEWHSYSGEKTVRLLSEHLDAQKGTPRQLLNAGSGVYQLSIPGWTEISVDLFDAPIRGRRHSIRASVEDLPFEACTFGAVVCVGEVLGYCDPARAIAEFGRVVTPQGILICDFGTTRSFRYWFRKQHARAAELVTDQYKGTPEPIWIHARPLRTTFRSEQFPWPFEPPLNDFLPTGGAPNGGATEPWTERLFLGGCFQP